jgi:hypothetical protein
MIIGRKVTHAAEVRDHIIDALRTELVGPSPGYPMVQLNGEEILRPRDPPRYRYACGILFPNGVTYSGSLDATEEAAGIDSADTVSADNAPADDAAVEDPTDDEASSREAANDPTPEVDTEMNAASMFLPSTMGISFLAETVGGLRIDIGWGTYRKEPLDGYPGVLGSERQAETGRDVEPWFRIPGAASVTLSDIDLREPSNRQPLASPTSQGILELDVVSRPWNGKRLITVTLINATSETKPVNENCFFQCGLSVVQRARPASNPIQDDPNRSKTARNVRFRCSTDIVPTTRWAMDVQPTGCSTTELSPKSAPRSFQSSNRRQSCRAKASMAPTFP